MNPLSKGSNWIKCDLQVQTYLDAHWNWPENYGNGDIKEKIDKFNNDLIQHCIDNQISVVAITDHNSGEAIDGLMVKNNELNNPITILPGVEVISSDGIHMIVIFDPKTKEDGDENRWDTWNDNIKHFLTAIKMPQPAFTNGGKVPEVARSTAEDIIKAIRDYRAICFFAHCCSTNGGLFCKSDSRTRKFILKFCNILDIAVELAQLPERLKKVSEELKNHGFNINDFAIINTSDSRRIDDIGKKFVWIKSEPTFEGIKQIIYEPKERVKIQQNSPYEDRQKIYLDSLEFTGRKNFIIPNIKIPLNRELVTIIGGRGSGKSALLESIAFLNEEHGKEDQNKKKKIIEYYRTNEDGKDPAPDFSLTVNLIDKDGNFDEYKKGLHEEDDLRLPFLYIGQEQLSIKATNDKELTKTICKVLNIDPADIQSNDIVDKSRNVLSEIDIAESELNDLLNKYPNFQNGNFIAWADDQLLKRKSQKKKISSRSTKDLLDDIDRANEKRQKLNDLCFELDTLKSSIENIDANDTIKEVNKDLHSHYPGEDIIPPIETNKQLEVINKLLAKIETDTKNIDRAIKEKKNSLTKLGLKEDVSVLLRSAELIQQEINLLTRDRKRYDELTKLIKEQKGIRNKLYDLVADYLVKVKNKIDDKFVEFLESRNTSSDEEKELFGSIIKGVGIEGKINFDQNKFCNDVLVKHDFIDKRMIKNVTELKSLIAGKDRAGKTENITLDILAKWVNNNLEEFLINPALKDGSKFLDYLFTEWDEFVSVNAIVKLNDVAIPKLSVGQRGTLLLKIYLSSASVKQIFIIDQPEDNLDNQFIMNELVPLIRKIKKSRQIIMSTHNANLVVNSDAEQVIVARIDSTDDYTSGGIEDPKINNDIKEILEGGENAFISRENKYGMGNLKLSTH